MDIPPPPPPPPPPPSPDDVPPPGPPSFDKSPQQPDNPYAAPTQAAMPAAGGPPQPPPPPAYPGAPAGGYGYPGAQQPPQPQQPLPPAYPGAPAGGYGYPAAPGVPQYPGRPYAGQPGVPQYPGPQYPGQPGYYVQPGQRGTNGMSIAALVLGLLPCIPLLGAIFGFIGLSQTKKRGERGKGMAVTGIIGSGAWLAIIVTLVVVGIMNTGNTEIADLKAGQCFNLVGEKISDFGDEGKTHHDTVDVVDCAERHDAEVVGTFTIQSDHDASYPGRATVGREAGTTCEKLRSTYMDGEDAPSDAEPISFIPSYDRWQDHDRGVVCFLGARDGKLVGSVKDGGGTVQRDGAGKDAGDDDSGLGV